MIISLFETVRLSVSISPRNLYNSLKSIKEIKFIFIVSSSGSCYNTGEYKNQNSFNFGNPLRSGVKNPYTKLLYPTWPVSSVESIYHINPNKCRGWSGGAMVLGKLPVPGRPTIWIQ